MKKIDVRAKKLAISVETIRRFAEATDEQMKAAGGLARSSGSITKKYNGLAIAGCD